MERKDLARVQRALTKAGFDAGRPDGLMGPRTRAAIEAFQRDAGLPVTGEADTATVSKLGAQPAVAPNVAPVTEPRPSLRRLLIGAVAAGALAIAAAYAPGLEGVDAGAIADAIERGLSGTSE